MVLQYLCDQQVRPSNTQPLQIRKEISTVAHTKTFKYKLNKNMETRSTVKL